VTKRECADLYLVDEREIGEKGLNLSGGQKARGASVPYIVSSWQYRWREPSIVAQESCCWMMVGLVLRRTLIPVLSAVDAHTAHALMENCLQGPILQNRTVLLVSHHTTLVSPAAAYIVALENVSLRGLFRCLCRRGTSSFPELEMIS
jgi:hypothetical protein